MLAQTRKEPGRLPAGVFAVVVHLAFAGLLIFGVSWQNKQSAPVEAELWNKLPSAPSKFAEPPAPPPRPKQEVKKQIPPEPVKAKPEVKPKVEKEEVQSKPDIALKEKLQKKKIEEEKLKVEQDKIKQAEAKKVEQDKKKKLAEEKAEQEQDEVLNNLLAQQKAAKARASASEAASAANASNAVIGTSIDRIRAKIKQNTQVPPDIAGQPRVVYKLVLLPSGDLLSVTLVKSSGNTAYDDAIARGIQKAAPLPLPPDSSLFSNFRELSLPFTHEK